MKTPPKPLPTIKAVLDEHVTLTVECLDRLYLNGYVPGLAAAVEPPWKVDVPHPLRDKLEELDLVLDRMLHHAHLQN